MQRTCSKACITPLCSRLQRSYGSRRRQAGARAASTAPALQGDASRQLAQVKTVCPICMQTEFELSGGRAVTQSLSCKRCARTFAHNQNYVDLTLTSGLQASSYKEQSWLGTETFRRPTVSKVYERGWRQSFAWAGFPGVETEFRYAMDYLADHYGSTLIDMSCGSGLFTRRFARSGKFKSVIAADFSETMLEQTCELLREDREVDAGKVVLLRADVGRLPFATGSVDAIHAGAAIHCWPNPTAALAEISRVLAPGGVFVGSTFLNNFAPAGQFLGNDKFFEPLQQFDVLTNLARPQFRWWSEDELRDLFASVGLQRFERHRSNRFILWSCQKPGRPQAQV